MVLVFPKNAESDPVVVAMFRLPVQPDGAVSTLLSVVVANSTARRDGPVVVTALVDGADVEVVVDLVAPSYGVPEVTHPLITIAAP